MRVALAAFAVLILSACGLEASDPPEQSAANEDVSRPPAVEQDQIPPAAPPEQRQEPYVREPEPRPRLTAEPWIERTAFATVSHAGSQTPAEVSVAHLAEVRRLTCGDQHVDYPPRFDDWHRLDLDGDGADEYLVFYTLEGFGGGNNYSRYLSVYRYVDPVWFASSSILVGGKGSLSVSGAAFRLNGGVLSVDALFPDDDDPMCCPSMDGEIAFDIGAGGALTPRPVAMSRSGQTFHTLLMIAASCR